MGYFQAMEEDSKTSPNVTCEDIKEEASQDSNVEFSEDERNLIARMFSLVGDRWNLIAGRIPGKSAEDIEKYWTSKSISST